jgi:hypothetical protein
MDDCGHTIVSDQWKYQKTVREPKMPVVDAVRFKNYIMNIEERK